MLHSNHYSLLPLLLLPLSPAAIAAAATACAAATATAAYCCCYCCRYCLPVLLLIGIAKTPGTGDNVLLDSNQNVRLTDLGLATEVSHGMVSQQGCVAYASKQKVVGQRFGAEDDM